MWRRITFEESIIIRKVMRGEEVDTEKLSEIGNKLTYSDMYRILSKYCPRIKIDEEKIDSIIKEMENW